MSLRSCGLRMPAPLADCRRAVMDGRLDSSGLAQCGFSLAVATLCREVFRNAFAKISKGTLLPASSDALGRIGPPGGSKHGTCDDSAAPALHSDRRRGGQSGTI